tara:strand:- start:327 stop:461 length:135 start_codon:yes stop_codon:yes gene_type:complete
MGVVANPKPFRRNFTSKIYLERISKLKTIITTTTHRITKDLAAI